MINCTQWVEINHQLYHKLSTLANPCNLTWLGPLKKIDTGTYQAKILLEIPNLRDEYTVLTRDVSEASIRELNILRDISTDMLDKRAPLLFPFMYARVTCENTIYAVLQPGGQNLHDVTSDNVLWWANVLYQISRAVYYLEEKRINHNNLSPLNVQFQYRQGNDLAMMLINFKDATQTNFVFGKDLNYLLFILACGKKLPKELADVLIPLISLKNIPPKPNEHPFNHGLRRAKIDAGNWKTSGKYISRILAKMYPSVAVKCNPARMNKVYGAGIGAVIGDAFGMPIEFDYTTPGVITKMYGSGKFEGLLSAYDLPPGTFTDDTQMALALIDSILLSGKQVSQQEIAKQFKRWAKSDPIDIGTQTLSVLKNVAIDGHNWEEASEKAFLQKPKSAANGATMRAWPIAVLNHDRSINQVVEDTKKQAQVTHMNSDAIYAAVFVNCIIHKLINGAGLNTAISESLTIVQDFISPELYAALTEKKPYKNLVGGSGWIVNTMSVVMWSIRNTNNFRDAIIRAANVRGDTDTNACITGAIAGALYGFTALPTDLLKTLDKPNEWNVWYGQTMNTRVLLDAIANVADC